MISAPRVQASDVQGDNLPGDRRGRLDGAVAIDSIQQRVALVLEYPVVFTRDLFAPDSTVLLDVLSAREPDRRHRVVVIVDRGVANAWPDLKASIVAYSRRHPAQLELAG